ncbi:MAG TPA: NTP transferase domain-containing protein [Actinomycetota bacterium]|nr:NTP transferase domain-containing protein [Actinomycetota bacterium]
MARLRAAILAAGRGVRMGGRSSKSLIPVGSEQPLLHYILEGLKRSGVEDLLVVTGFAAKEVQEFVGSNWTGEPTFLFNARWASWGNFHTVRMALDQSPGFDVLVVNSDVVVPPDVYARTASTGGDLVLAVQRRANLDDEDMRVEVHGDEVRQIGKKISMARSHGEYAGVSLIRPTAARTYLDIATDLEWRAETHGYYEDIYAQMIGKVDTRATFVRGDEYAEVDSPEDVPHAADVIARHRDAWEQPAGQEQPA